MQPTPDQAFHGLDRLLTRHDPLGLLTQEGKVDEEQRTALGTAIGCKLHFGSSKALLALEEGELAAICGLSLAVCQGFLNRMSQEFGYRNPEAAGTFSDPLSAPWDYNTLYERLFKRRDGRYWLVLFSVVSAALLLTLAELGDRSNDTEREFKFAPAR